MVKILMSVLGGIDCVLTSFLMSSHGLWTRLVSSNVHAELYMYCIVHRSTMFEGKFAVIYYVGAKLDPFNMCHNF